MKASIPKKKVLIAIQFLFSLLLTACNGTLATSVPALENNPTPTPVTTMPSSSTSSIVPTTINPPATVASQITTLVTQTSVPPTIPNSVAVSLTTPPATFTVVIATTPTPQAIKISNIATVTQSPSRTTQPHSTATVLSIPVASAISPDAQEQAFLQLLNDYRKANAQPALVFEPVLFKSARWLAQDMANQNYIGHTDSLGRNISARLRAFGYTGNVPGENIAGGLEQANANLKIWQSDDIHKNNLLGAYYTKAGVARYYSPNSSNRWYWVLDLG